jgi:prepilin-type N-terminal cleavage/methylation domain-containing protein
MVRRGFTLIELLVAMTIVALLLSIVVPRYFGGMARAEEAALRENLYLMRDAIDKHYTDTGAYPGSLEELTAKKYIRAVPVDPMTKKSDWTLIPAATGGIFDIRSGAKGAARDGKPYEEW